MIGRAELQRGFAELCSRLPHRNTALAWSSRAMRPAASPLKRSQLVCIASGPKDEFVCIFGFEC
jgi:hypothetical protein